MDPPTWFTTIPATMSIDGFPDEPGRDPLLRRVVARRPIPLSARAAVIAHGTTTAGTARATLFAMNPLYRADPEHGWSMAGLAAYWADEAPTGTAPLRESPGLLAGPSVACRPRRSPFRRRLVDMLFDGMDAYHYFAESSHDSCPRFAALVREGNRIGIVVRCDSADSREWERFAAPHRCSRCANRAVSWTWQIRPGAAVNPGFGSSKPTQHGRVAANSTTSQAADCCSRRTVPTLGFSRLVATRPTASRTPAQPRGDVSAVRLTVPRLLAEAKNSPALLGRTLRHAEFRLSRRKPRNRSARPCHEIIPDVPRRSVIAVDTSVHDCRARRSVRPLAG